MPLRLDFVFDPRHFPRSVSWWRGLNFELPCRDTVMFRAHFDVTTVQTDPQLVLPGSVVYLTDCVVLPCELENANTNSYVTCEMPRSRLAPGARPSAL